jgi:uncharacterized protein YbbC (DUF1343 family)
VAGAKDLDLQVAKCGGYKHSTLYSLPVAPSPNLRTMAAVYAYPSLCLFEGTPVSVGRGTQSPFTQWGCPEFEGKFRYTFTPQSTEGATHPPYEGKVCYGEDLGNEAGMTYTALNGRFRLWWLIKAYRAYPDKEKFFTPFFTKLAGTAKLQQQVKDGMTEAQIRATWQPDLDAFKAIRKKYLLYEE